MDGVQNHRSGDKAYFYAVLGLSKAHTFDVFINGTILICDRMTFVLFDPRYTFSYMLVKFSLGWDLTYKMLNVPIYVSTLFGVSLCVD